MGKKISAYDPGDGDGGDFIIAKGGTNYKVTGNAPNGPAILDAEGKLAQPRRVVDAQFSVGSTADPGTAAAYMDYILPDPRITVDMEAGQIAVVQFSLSVYTTDGADVYAVAGVGVSEDGGTTWTEAGKALVINTGTANRRQIIAGVAHYQPTSSGTINIGIMMGNAPGNSYTIKSHYTRRNLSVLIVDV